ncbi:MAG TPA: hypothetical protein VIO60_06990 [Rectinemataceae bacterium]
MSPAQAPSEARLLGFLPRIRRARGYRLYAENGLRLLDLWADGGRTVLGRKPEGRGRLAKEIIDKGLVSGLPSPWEGRLLKALGLLFPKVLSFALFSSETEARAALEAEKLEFATERPFGEYLIGKRGEQDRFLAILPLEPDFSPGVIGFPNSSTPLLRAHGLPISPLKAALAARSIPGYMRMRASSIESRWAKVDRHIVGLFSRSGPWLRPIYPETEHERVFREALDLGLLISPEYHTPSMIPADFDSGEIALLGKISRHVS